MQLLHSYTNGNTKVSIYNDGTKVREYEDAPCPSHPESMDVKITNYCDGGCRWCHEKSTLAGQHADLDRLLKVIKGLPAGVEIACGGGNPLSHPNLFPFLRELKGRGLIANMTVNQKHFSVYGDEIRQLLAEDLIHGLGVSYNNSDYLNDIAPFVSLTDNLVFHVIMGINDVTVIDDLCQFVEKSGGKSCKVLILGYKEYGNGNGYYSLRRNDIEDNKLRWYRHLATYFKSNNLTLSFDNLAIRQLNLHRFFTDKAWEKFYMGDDGRWTLFVDAVKQEFAVCSVDPNRVSFDDTDLFTFFKNIPQQSY